MKDSLNVPYVFFTSQGKSPKQLHISAVPHVRNFFVPKLWNVQFVYCTVLHVTLYGFTRKGEEPPVHWAGRGTFRQAGQHSCGITDDLSLRFSDQLYLEATACVFILILIFFLIVIVLIHFFFPSKGCKSGVRSELACFDLMAAVRSLPFPLTFPWGFNCLWINMQHKTARLHTVHPIRFMVWNIRP